MKKILVAFDGGEPARRALDTAVELARKFDATIAVVSVVPVHPGRSPIDPWDDTSTHAHELLEARKILREAGFEADLLEPAGDPAKTIERIVDDGGYDTVVMGSRGLERDRPDAPGQRLRACRHPCPRDGRDRPLNTAPPAPTRTLTERVRLHRGTAVPAPPGAAVPCPGPHLRSSTRFRRGMRPGVALG